MHVNLPMTCRLVVGSLLWLGLLAEGSEDPLLSGLTADPHADQDIFLSLTPEQLDIFGDDQPELGVDELLEKTQNFPLSTPVTVKLIGWDGKGRYGIDIPASTLTTFLKELHSDLPLAVLNPKGGKGNRLPITDKFYYSVEHAGEKLTQVNDNRTPKTVCDQLAAQMWLCLLFSGIVVHFLLRDS